MKNYYVLAYYKFTKIDDPHELVRLHKKFFKDRDVSARIYISEEGINGQMSAAKEDANAYMEWLRSFEPFKNLEIKIHHSTENVFPRITVKYRKQIVAFDREVNIDLTAPHLSATEWDAMMKEEQNKVLIDVRNDYEWKIGHFKGSDLPDCDTFRNFPAYTERLKERIDPKETTVMMCCTGGIRCELYSAYLKEQGFEKVYQLDGGIIKYGMETKDNQWQGKLFVFDDRMAVPINPNSDVDECGVIAECHFCQTAEDTYYNCANMDCNELFISCKNCIKTTKGCCCKECSEGLRLRPYHEDTMHKPFRRKHMYQSNPNPVATA